MEKTIKTVLVTGSKGFIGSNLVKALEKRGLIVLQFDKDNSFDYLYDCLQKADFVYHFAAVQRPEDLDYSSNVFLSKRIIDFLLSNNLKTPIFFSSSVQAEQDNPYGRCKIEEEKLFLNFSKDNSSKVYICRFSNIFGPGSKPNYTSVVSTFIYNIITNKPITINDTNVRLNLLYIDNVVDYLINLLQLPSGYNAVNYLDSYYTIDLISLLYVVYCIKNRLDTSLKTFNSQLINDLKKTYSFFEHTYLS